ncbi:MAG: DUF1571 domain-containing protein [Proteobacteria bacterium]|nr:DUF1571 domain-containing protein [Pseudomonadota bacterium]
MKKTTYFKQAVILFPAILLLALCISPLNASTDNSSESYDPRPLVEISKQALNQISDYTATFIKQERFGKKMGKLETIEFKFRKPNDVYMKWIGDANKNQEALFRKGHNEDRVKAHKGGLLNIININSQPEGKLAMDGQHHRIVDAGIGPTSALVYRGMDKGLERNEATFINHGIVKEDGRELIKVEALYPEKCEGVTHTVAKDETLWDIANKYNQDMYVILSNNKGVSGPTDVKEGQQILVPYHYCRRAITYTEKNSNLLVKLEIYDWDNNLYEFYEFKDIKMNVGLTDKDFDPENPEYKF